MVSSEDGLNAEDRSISAFDEIIEIVGVRTYGF